MPNGIGGEELICSEKWGSHKRAEEGGIGASLRAASCERERLKYDIRRRGCGQSIDKPVASLLSSPPHDLWTSPRKHSPYFVHFLVSLQSVHRLHSGSQL